MNTNSSSLLAIANSVVVIDANGQVRELLPGESPQPGEVVVSAEQGDSAPPQIDAQLVNDNGVLNELNLDNEIAAIFDQIEQGVDPTLNEEFATAAGGQNGSSLTGSGDIERIGTETIASTSFDTTGLESQGLSETQSLSLLDVVQDSLTPQAIILGDDSVRADETDEPLVLTGSLVATESEDTSFIPQTDVQGEYGLFSIDAEGNWTFTADHAFDELNVGDSIVEVFEVQSGDGTIASVSVAIDGTNDLPEFVATGQEAPADDVNLAPFNVSSYAFDYSEGASAGETIGQVAATDPDNSVLIFSISTNLQDGEGNDLYQINPATGEISLTEAGTAAFVNDFEQLSNSHNIVVTVTEGDGVGEPQSVDVDVFLNEQNLDDNPPTFEDVDDGGYSFNYNENVTDTDVIGVVSASDPDGENVTYSIATNVTNDADEPLFEIDANSGEISLTAAGVAAFTNDFELASNVHNIVVTATEDEGLGDVKSTNINVELSELNLDEDSPIFVDDDDNPVADYAFEYNENSLDNDVIGSVSAVDGDGENVTYSIATNVTNDADEPLFEIDANSGEVSLTAAGVAAFTNDFELASNVHNIVVTATEDEGLGDVKSTNINVELSELNLDEDSPIFVDEDDNPVEDYAFEYNENSLDSDVIGTVSAVDGDGENVTYSITTNVTNDADEPLFEIDATSGEISLTAAGVAAFTNDFELASNVHNIVVTATEDEGLGEVKSTNINVELSELNLDEDSPIFVDDDDNPVEDYAFEYNENSLDSDVIGTVAAVDVDGENVTYSITTNVTNDADEPLFEIDANSGEISLTAAGVAAFTNDFELASNVHNIVVTATEDEGLGEVKSTNINVELSELNLDEDSPIFVDEDDNPVEDYAFEYNENSLDSDVIGTVSAVDGDGEDVTYSITTNVTNDADEPLFEIDATSGEISLTAAGVAAFTNDFELASNVHNIVVTATEDEGLGDVKSTNINVELSELNLDEDSPIFVDEDDNPVEDYAFEYNENSLDSDVIGIVAAVDGDGENVTYSITTNVTNDSDEPLFEIDANSGEISLTAAGVAAFTNDFELASNVHNIVVTATEDEGLGDVKSTNINVELSELNLDEDSPIFVDEDDNPVEDYAFEYNENSLDSDVIGTVSAVDGDGENVTYSITTNVTNDSDEPLFEIDANSGEISLTAAGVAAFTNDFELASNVHNIVVTATEDEGLGDVKSTNINVELSELNLDEDSPIFVDDDDNPVEDYAFEYNENSLDSDVIGTVAAVDGDGENVTYSITTNVTNDADEPLFEIDANSGEISLTAAGVAAFTNDFELASNVHNIVVTATEDEGLGDVKSTNINVELSELNLDEDSPIFVDDDDNPVEDYAFEYNENSLDSDVIGTVAAVDVDGENVTYSITTNVTNDADEPLFEIDANSGEISLTAAGVAAFTNDFELASNVHNIVVTATEDEGLGEVKSTNINVELSELNLDEDSPIFVDEDDNPVEDYAFEYNENSLDSDVIGTVSAVDGDGEDVTYSITTNVTNDADEPLFEIDATSGEISLTAAGVAAFTNDFELASNVHNIVVTATEDEGLGDVKSTNINVELSELNLDEDSPIFVDEDDNPVEDYAFEYNENSLDSDVIGIVAAVDGDGENVTYSITTNVTNDSDEPLFEIDANSGEISLTAAGVAAFTNDFELASNVHNIVVTATEDEGLGDVKSTNINVELSELNLDEDSPIFVDEDDNPVEDYAFEYNENSLDSDVIGTVSAVDGDGENVTYSITTNVTNDSDEPLFEIDANSGEISLTAAGVAAFTNDFELASNVHNIVVTATEDEGLGDVKSTNINVELSELNLDEDSPIFVDDDDNPVEDYAFEYNENSLDSDVIGTVAAVDGDGENVTYSITTNVTNDADEPLFEIDANSGEISLTAAGVAAFTNDFELASNVHNIVVTATEDEGLGDVKSTNINVELSELNLDEDSPIFVDDDDNPVEDYAFEYNENSLDSDVIGTVAAVDGDGENVTYSITTNVTNDADEPLFEIDANSGEISLTAVGVAAFTNDFELASNVHNIVVTATEDEGLGDVKSTNINVELSELNLDEDSPIFVDDDDNPVADYAFEYNENSLDSDVIGTVSAVDGDGENVTYSITTNVTNDADEPLFEIDATSGEISLTAAGVAAFTNDFELASNVHNIVVTATEDEGLGDVKSTNINVELSELNLDEDSPIFVDDDDNPVEDYAFEYNENSLDSDVIGTVAAVDSDGENVTYSISTNVTTDADEPLFEIDANSGEVSLTAAGVAAFTNDFELASNVHNIVVTATEDEGLGDVKSTNINVELSELNLDEDSPIFVDDDDNPVEDYAFEYNENSLDSDVIGTVAAVDGDGENVTYSITTNVTNDADEPLFEIDANSGEISLTAAGVAAFTNDFELASSVHNIVVTATEDEGLGDVKSTNINVELSELNLDEDSPIFVDDDDNPVEDYAFEYNENSLDSDVIGTVAAVDGDGENVTYSITTNVTNDADEPLFEIDANSGEISLTAAGVAAFTNDFELASNVHNIVVTATEDEGLGEVKSTNINVELSEINLDDNDPTFNDTNQEGEYYFSYDENSSDDYVIGTVSATDGDGEEIVYSIKENVVNDADEPLFEIDTSSGQISLTVAGVIAFTNDFELAGNVHSLVVTATEVDGLGPIKSTDVQVTLEELNIDDNAPVFDANDGDQYSFSYDENNNHEHVIGTVSATDADGEDVTYSITTNVTNDANEPLFTIDSSSGSISLTAAGVLAFTNNFEALANAHTLVVTATEVDGFGIQKSTNIDVVLTELNVNELPVAEDFEVDAGEAIVIPIVFDSDVEEFDHISDEDDDFNDVQLNVMLTSLPEYGTLLYTDDFGDTRVITEADLHVIGAEIDSSKLFDPDNISYVPGPGEAFEIGYSGDPDNIVLDEDGFYNWGEYVSDTERLITLNNGNTIGISITDNNDKPLKQYTGGPAHVGWGIGDTDGNGLNAQETLIVDLSDNPLDVVTFGLDGMGAGFNTNSNVYVEVTYTFADGTTAVEQYQKDEGEVGNDKILYEFSYSSPDNPITKMELSSTGSNWEFRYLSGNQDITEDVSFDYVAVDSDLAISNEATVTIDVSDSPEYTVLSAELGEDLTAQLGNQMMLGDDNSNVFTWFDTTLDNGTDVIDNFKLGSDLIDLREILQDDDNVEVADLVNQIDVSISEDDVVFTVSDEGREQTIVLEGVYDSFADAGLIVNNAITDELEMLTQVLKTDAA